MEIFFEKNVFFFFLLMEYIDENDYKMLWLF